jgi:hypothetical protein
MHSTYLTKNNMTVIPHPTYLPDLVPCNFSVPPIEDETVTPSQKFGFQDTFKKNGRSAGNGAYAWKVATSRVIVTSRPLVLDQVAAAVPEITNEWHY